ncbi:MAG: Beta-mannosidase [Caulobacter sp.]|nr:Beta-mannosidase [Caulobacter sp.]
MTHLETVGLERWEIRDFDPGSDRAAEDESPGWIAVHAPADTYQALVEAGRLAHPFQGRNEAAAAWVRDREWWWRTGFQAPARDEDQLTELVFEGLDTFADIYLDGALIGRTDNMFRRHVFDVGAALRPGETHRLAIRFTPTALADLPPETPPFGGFVDRISRSKRNLMRKAQFGWGWDWGPDLPTVGIWQPASIMVRNKPRLADVRFVTTEASTDRAHAVVHLGLEGIETAAARIEIALADPAGDSVFVYNGPAVAELGIDLDNPQLWWTADLGGQPLYGLAVRLFEGERLLDEVRHTVGLRTIGLDQSPDPDEPGTTFFRFVLNGVPIFAKGACWIPATSFVGDLDPAAYERLVAQSAAANMNMIRIWGGGVYEPDLFYDLCDRLGLLVWQDFMFACAPYPEDGDFAASVAREVEDQVRRLRHHACLALWCGNNENQAIHRFAADMTGDKAPLSGAALYDELFPTLLGRLDPSAPYWPGSPWGGAHPNSMRAGDVHDWTVWHGLPPVPGDLMVGAYDSTPEGMAYTRYAEDMGRFISEFGIQAAPALATLKRWMDPGDLEIESPGFLERIKDEARKANALMTPVTGLPDTLEQYVDFTQWTQAEGLKFGIEHFRRRNPHCAGALLWQLNDCWPCVSWSLIDFDGVEKAAYHAVRRAFAPVLASFKEADGQVELWITNDTLAPINGEAVVALESLDGKTVWRETVAYAAPAGGHARPWSGPTPRDPAQVLRVSSAEGAFEANRLLPVPISRLPMSRDPKLSMAITRIAPDVLRLDISAQAYAPFVHLVSDRPDLRFDDNYFDLAAGESRSVRVTAASAVSPHDLAVRSWTPR